MTRQGNWLFSHSVVQAILELTTHCIFHPGSLKESTAYTPFTHGPLKH